MAGRGWCSCEFTSARSHYGRKFDSRRWRADDRGRLKGLLRVLLLIGQRAGQKVRVSQQQERLMKDILNEDYVTELYPANSLYVTDLFSDVQRDGNPDELAILQRQIIAAFEDAGLSLMQLALAARGNEIMVLFMVSSSLPLSNTLQMKGRVLPSYL